MYSTEIVFKVGFYRQHLCRGRLRLRVGEKGKWREGRDSACCTSDSSLENRRKNLGVPCVQEGWGLGRIKGTGFLQCCLNCCLGVIRHKGDAFKKNPTWFMPYLSKQVLPVAWWNPSICHCCFPCLRALGERAALKATDGVSVLDCNV